MCVRSCRTRRRDSAAAKVCFRFQLSCLLCFILSSGGELVSWQEMRNFMGSELATNKAQLKRGFINANCSFANAQFRAAAKLMGLSRRCAENLLVIAPAHVRISKEYIFKYTYATHFSYHPPLHTNAHTCTHAFTYVYRHEPSYRGHDIDDFSFVVATIILT